MAGMALTSSALPRPAPPPASDGEYATGQVLVKYRSPNALPTVLEAMRQWSPRVSRRIPQIGVVVLQIPAGAEMDVIAQLRRDPRVQYAELNHRARALETPNDPLFPQQWALARIKAPQAWDIAHCRGVIIAILDTGAYLEHPDLRNVLWTNPGEIAGNGIDDDGNDKIDDVHGWHFFHLFNGSTYEPYENRILDDDNGHGTHVTGIAAAETNNITGTAGVSWGAQAMIVKVLDQEGNGWYSDVAAGIIYAVDNGAEVINLSLGGSHPDQTLQDAVNYAYAKGALLVAAAGNDGAAGVFYPAACEHVIAVAATDQNDAWADFSNYGPEVDIAAPGESILSTWPWLDLYYYKHGTSMATPHVSGAAALLWSLRPDWSNAQIEQRLELRADDVNAAIYPGRDPYLGWGRLNVYRALEGLQPGPTRTPTLTPGPSHTPDSTQHVYYLPLVMRNCKPPTVNCQLQTVNRQP